MEGHPLRVRYKKDWAEGLSFYYQHFKHGTSFKHETWMYSGSIGGGELTQPIPGDKGADQLRGVPIIGQFPGTGQEVQNREGVADDGQTHSVKYRAV